MNKVTLKLLLIATLLLGCTGEDDPDSTYRDDALLDVNSTSPTFNQYVIPEDYEGLISAWYFGLST